MNFSGDKKLWPVYLTIDNIPSQTRSSPSKMAVILVALLHILPQFMSKKIKMRGAQQTMNGEIQDGVFSLIFEPFKAAMK